MKKLVSLMALICAACGGSAGSNGSGTAPATADFQANALTYDKVGIAQNDSDDNEPGNTSGSAQPAPTALTFSTVSASATRGDTDACHPHLFLNTDEVIGRVNRHFTKLVQHVEPVSALRRSRQAQQLSWCKTIEQRLIRPRRSVMELVDDHDVEMRRLDRLESGTAEALDRREDVIETRGSLAADPELPEARVA